MEPSASAPIVVKEPVTAKGTSRKLDGIALCIFLVNLLLCLPSLTPQLEHIGVWDESQYLQQGKELTEGTLPGFIFGPLVTAMQALAYLPVRHSHSWMSFSCSISRFLMFTMLWWGAYLLARSVERYSHRLVMAGLLLGSSAMSLLITNASHAMFAAMSCFAFWRFVEFMESKRMSHLAQASLFIGLSALCRSEGLILFASFLALSAWNLFRHRRLVAGAVASIFPFVTLVGGYLLLQSAMTGHFEMATQSRSYFVFEQGHSFAYSDRYPDKNAYLEGTPEARRLFGTREENNDSVIKAIMRNPGAYCGRIPRLAKTAFYSAAEVYGQNIFFLCITFALVGLAHMAVSKDLYMIAALAAWSSYCLLYILLCFQNSHLAIPFPILFLLASAGAASFVRQCASRARAWTWSLALVLLAVCFLMQEPMQPFLLPSLLLLVGVWMIRLLARLNSGKQDGPAVFLILFSMALLAKSGEPHQNSLMRGVGPEERVVHKLRELIPDGAAVGTFAPGRIWAANKIPISITPRLFEAIHTAQAFADWLDENGIEAIYCDRMLVANVPEFRPIAVKLLHKKLKVAHIDQGANVMILSVVRATGRDT